MKQRDLFALLPGVAGGRALVEQRGASYFAQIGARGGIRTAQMHDMRALGRRGALVRRWRRYTLRTEHSWDGLTYRVIPWWPHDPRRRRRKYPEMVRIQVD